MTNYPPLVGESPVTWEQYTHRILSRQAYPTRSHKDMYGKTIDPWSLFYLTLNMQCQSDHVRQYIKDYPDIIRVLLKHKDGVYPPPLNKVNHYLRKIEQQVAKTTSMFFAETSGEILQDSEEMVPLQEKNSFSKKKKKKKKRGSRRRGIPLALRS